ncbi:MAG: hypothetical protein GF331_16015 [Chitinivibrionales bacterium]|nr:hypothetical protein [Chitinivibrionales bacterium]
MSRMWSRRHVASTSGGRCMCTRRERTRRRIFQDMQIMPPSDPLRHNQLVNIARLYYLRKLTHQQIADKLSLSRVKVTRLLQQAVEEGVVEFRIADPALDAFELQDQLEQRFGLTQAIVVPSGESVGEALDNVGRFAARWLTEHLHDNGSVGIGWGNTLNGMVPHLSPVEYAHVSVVSLTGGLAANANQPNPYDTATAIARALGAVPQYLALPAIVESESTRDVLMQEPTARRMRERWAHLDVCMMSIGRLSPQTGVFYSFSDPDQAVRDVQHEGGVGDLLARPIRVDGTFVETDYSRRLIAADVPVLKQAPFVAGVAAGVAKVDAIIGALRSELLNVLITDDQAAERVLRRL